MKSFDVILVNIGSLVGFLRWAALAVLVFISFYLIYKQKQVWKLNLGIVSLVVSVLLTPVLILNIVVNESEKDTYVPDTSIDTVTVNPLPSPTENSEPSQAQNSWIVYPTTPSSNSGSGSSEIPTPAPEPTPEPESTSHSINIDNASIEGDSEGGKYEAGSTVKITANNKVGYHFDKWFGNDDAIKDKTDNPLEFVMPNSDLTVYPVYLPNSDTTYKVVHQKQNLNNNDYTTFETESFTGTTDTDVTPAVKSYDGFTSPATKTEKISGDGQMSITYQYPRNSYSLTILDSQYVTQGDISDDYPYERSITVSAMDRTGDNYNFVHWVDENDQEISTNTSYTFVMPAGALTLRPVYEDTFPTVWSLEGQCNFNAYKDGNNDPHGLVSGPNCTEYATANTGKEYIDTGVSLYSSENVGKDYEVSFTINHFAIDEQLEANQESVFSAKGYNNDSGVAFRLGNSTYSLVSSTTTSGSAESSVSIKGGLRVTISRIDGDLYYKTNDSAYILLQENADDTDPFALASWFGAAPNDNEGNTSKQFITGVLSDMSIKLGDNNRADFYEITFDPNGGSMANRVFYVQKGDQIGTLPKASRSKYALVGWNDSDGQAIASTTVPQGDETYTADWISNIDDARIPDNELKLIVGDESQVRVTNRDSIEPITFSSNNAAVAYVNPNTGALVAVGVGETDVVIIGNLSNKTRTVHIVVYASMYTIHFDFEDGGATEDVTIFPGSKIDPLPSKTREGWTFLGWFTEPLGDGVEIDENTEMNTDDATYYAFWDKGASDVMLVCKKATDLHEETCNKSKSEGCLASNRHQKNDVISYGILPDSNSPSVGYAYNCDVNYDSKYNSTTERFYYIGEDNGNAILVSHSNFEGMNGQNASNIFLYANAFEQLPRSSSQWKNPHLVQFDFDSVQDTRAARILTKDDIENNCVNSQTGEVDIVSTCEFLGENSRYTTDSSSVRSAMWLQKVDTTYYRVHSNTMTVTAITSKPETSSNFVRPVIEVPMEYVQSGSDVSVTFDANGGEGSIQKDLPPSEPLGTLPTVTNAHGEFDGWWTEPTGGTEVTKYTIPNSSNVAYYAHWIWDTYTVTFTSEAGQYAQETVAHGSTVSAPVENPNDKTNYHFVEWRAQGESTAFDFSTAITSELTLEAYYEINTYTVTFNSEAGQYAQETVAHGNIVSAPANNPNDKANYHFVEWRAQGESTAFDFSTVITGDLTIEAYYEIDTHTVTFYSDGSVYGEPVTVNHGETVLAPENNPTKQEYVFVKWVTTDGGSTAFDFGSAIEANTDIYAEFASSAHTVTFYSDGSVYGEPVTVSHDSTVSAPANNPTKQDYHFIEWRKQGETSAFDFTSSITDDINLDAYFESDANSYQVTFVLDNGENNIEFSQTYNTAIGSSAPAKPTKADNNFAGWFDASTGGNKIADIASEVITHDTIYYAHWVEIICRAASAPLHQSITQTGSNPVTYGTVPSAGMEPQAGYAYDCDVDGENGYDTDSERFYYLETVDGTAILLYSAYTNANGMVVNAKVASAWSGAEGLLPTSAWTRNGVTTRIPTRDDLIPACGPEYDLIDDSNAMLNCNYVLEKTSSYAADGIWGTSSQKYPSAYWLQREAKVVEPGSDEDYKYYRVHSNGKQVASISGDTPWTSSNGVKPVIEIDNLAIERVPAVTYSIDFESNGGSPVSSTTVTSGQPISNFDSYTSTREGYRFFGWYTNQNLNVEVNAETLITSDMTLYAKWVSDDSSYPIVFAQTDACNFNGTSNITGSGCTDYAAYNYINTNIPLYSSTNIGQDFEIGFTIVAYNTNLGDMHSQATFVNAKKEKDTDTYPGFVVRKSSGNIQITSKWNDVAGTVRAFIPVNGMQIKVYRQNGSIYSVVDNGAPVLLQDFSPEPIEDMENVMTWFGGVDRGGDVRPLIGTLTDMYIKIKAPEPITQYTVTFDGNGGTPAETQVSGDVGQSVSDIPSVLRENYSFDGWYDAPDDGNLVSDGTTSITPTGNDTYYAHWTLNQGTGIVEHYSSSEAVREYFANIDTWNADETTLWSNLKHNFDGHKCFGPDKDDVSTDFAYTYSTTGAEVYCDKDIPFDTGFASANVYLSDETTKAKGDQVSYTNSSTGKISNMIPGQVYYYEDASDSSKYGYVKAVNERRIMTVGSIRNVRDLGGWSVSGTNTLDGSSYTGKISYSYLFRGAELLSGKGNATALLDAGITKQYELRTDESGDRMSNYAHTGLYNYDFDVSNATRYEMARTAVTSIMEDVAYNNEKVYFHCTHGADRTGSVAYLLEGLLGVSEEDRNQEYELTTFSGQADKTRFYDHKDKNYSPSWQSKCGTGEFDPCKKYVYMQTYVRTNQEIYNWYTYNRTGADLDYDNQLIQDFRDKVLTYN